MPRFYIAPEQWNPNALALTGPEAHHAHDVLRLTRGAHVVVFNGVGAQVTAEITRAGRDQIELRKIDEQLTPALPCRVALAQAIPKGKNMELIVQKAVELGAAEIIPLFSERTVVQLNSAGATHKRDKWQQVAIEAAKQCGQNWLPEIRPLQSAAEFFASGEPACELQLIGSLQPGARHLKDVLVEYRREQHNSPRSVLICIGPEGDFTPSELGLARARGCHPITFGPIVLRVETAAIYCLSVLSYELLSG